MEIDKEIEVHQKLVYFTINKFFPKLKDDEDIIQTGMIALWKALVSKPSNKAFSSYAVKTIKNAILTELKQESAKKRNMDKTIKVIYLDDKDCNQEELIGVDEIPYRLIEMKEYHQTTQKKKREIMALIMSGYNLKEISQKMKTPYSQIYRLWKEIKSEVNLN